MRKEIRLMFDYQCYPIWIYDENGKFIDNDLVEEIEKDENMVARLEELQDVFDSLYLNNKEAFKYIGFTSDDERKKFIENVLQVYNELCTLLTEKYIVKNMVDIQNM